MIETRSLKRLGSHSRTNVVRWLILVVIALFAEEVEARPLRDHRRIIELHVVVNALRGSKDPTHAYLEWRTHAEGPIHARLVDPNTGPTILTLELGHGAEIRAGSDDHAWTEWDPIFWEISKRWSPEKIGLGLRSHNGRSITVLGPSGEPVVGAIVQIGSDSRFSRSDMLPSHYATDESGRIHALSPDLNDRLRIFPPLGYSQTPTRAFQKELDAAGGDLEVRLQPGGQCVVEVLEEEPGYPGQYEVFVRIEDPVTGEVIRDRAYGNSSMPGRRAVFTGIPPGRHTVRITRSTPHEHVARGRGQLRSLPDPYLELLDEVPIDVRVGEVTIETIHVPPARTYRGRLLIDGRPAAGQIFQPYPFRIGEDGEYELRLRSPKTRSIQLDIGDERGVRVPWRLEPASLQPGETREKDIELRHSTLRVRITDDVGRPRPGVPIAVRNRWLKSRSQTSGTDGVAVFSGLLTHDYSITTADAAKWSCFGSSVTLTTDREVGVVVVGNRSVTIDADALKWRSAEFGSRSTPRMASGTFRIPDAPGLVIATRQASKSEPTWIGWTSVGYGDAIVDALPWQPAGRVEWKGWPRDRSVRIRPVDASIELPVEIAECTSWQWLPAGRYSAEVTASGELTRLEFDVQVGEKTVVPPSIPTSD